MAPEILPNEPSSWPADVWATACVIVEIYSGKVASIPSEEDFKRSKYDPYTCYLKAIRRLKVPPLLHEVPYVVFVLVKASFACDYTKRPHMLALLEVFRQLPHD